MASHYSTAAPFPPLDYDNGLRWGFEDPAAHSLHGDMTQQHFALPDDEESAGNMLWVPDEPYATLSSRAGNGTASKSPAAHSHQASVISGGSASLSPATDALIYTPASTLLDFHEDTSLDDPESDILSTSPESNFSPADDFHLVPRSDGEPGGGNRGIALWPPPTTGLHGPPDQMSHPSRESSVSQPTHPTQTPQWHSFTSTSSAGMEDSYAPYSAADDSMFLTGSFAETASISHATDFDPALYGHTLTAGSFTDVTPSYHAAALLPQQTSQLRHPGSINPAAYFNSDLSGPYDAVGRVVSTPQYNGPMHAHDFAYHANHVAQSPAQVEHPRRVIPSHARPLPQQGPQNTLYRPEELLASKASRGHATYPLPMQAAPPQVARQQPQPSSSRQQATARPILSSAGTSHTPNQYPSIVKAEPLSTPTRLIRSSQSDRVRKGGRSRNSHLNDTSRQKSHAMRKVGACWRCVLQRDPCDEGQPCSRCLMKSQKGQTYYFDCDRSKLPDFLRDFLPPSMTLMHQKQYIEDTVQQEVLAWDKDNGIDIYMSSGYGPPMRWKVYEFQPRTPELLSQLQYRQNSASGQTTAAVKYSPPFGLLKLDMSDDLHFDAYLDRLLEPAELEDFGWSCYEEECIFDEEEFQAKLLDLMCKLYIHTQDIPLKTLLRDILRMMIVTFIMGHTLTIVEQTLPTVLDSVKHSRRPPQVSKHTSPRLANRQLKFFFAIIRANIYEKILKWQQQTLHTAGKKEQTWLQAFCATLGFAMVLEELQRTIQIQAEAAAAKHELSEHAAQAQAFNACERIDARFKLLVGLFQCKYRDKTWGATGSFGPCTPELRDATSRSFCHEVRKLVERRQSHLRSRENVQFHRDTGGLYTTRLTARFLLPFLNLPAT